MCFDIGFQIKKVKYVRMKKSDGNDESKGLLMKEIERWKKRQDKSDQQNTSSTLSSSPPSKSNSNSNSSH
ncbi:hypothetical protein HS088_TW03G00151 [Tripterygium wilfordii]|uniref:Uncharacterized protein n=1 Tax=Tripterygium wilfordii TaxID=458696 RepID=A0A7J7DTX8_TRIWF|nr:hypothetical protein HS088_TW03G00151 [Tripterygium wilfordii]